MPANGIRSILCAIALLLTTPLQSAAQEGVVTYEESTVLDLQLPPEMAHMRDQIPSARTITQVLHFNASASLMKAAPQDEEASHAGDVTASHGDVTIRLRTSGPGDAESATYVDFDAAERIEQRSFLGRTFLITGSAEPLAWRLTDERSEFLGYMAQKAVATRDTTTIEAWFTPEIPVPAGPASYGGLPGLILVLTLDNGRVSYVAKEVTLGSVETGVIAPPEKGRRVTRDEFDAIVAEKRKEMQADGSGRVFIIRQ